MTITYMIDGVEYQLTYQQSGEWSGGHEGYAEALNIDFVGTVGRFEYYPTPWHKVNHVATVLRGTLDTPEPKFETGDPGEGKVW